MITLINPWQDTNYPQPPLGLATIAAILEREKIPVKLIDANALRLKDVRDMVKSADVVGITAMTPTIHNAAEVARQVKGVNKNVIVVLGGVHGTLMPDETLNAIPEIDIIIRGEGEEAILELMNNKPLYEIQGVSFRDFGRVQSTQSRKLIEDLDGLPFLAYNLLPRARYRPHPPHGRAFPFITMTTSRGCPYKCNFCSKPIFGSAYRAQSAKRVIDEIQYYIYQLGVKEIAFYDDVFTLDKKRVHDICDGLLKQLHRIHWTCESRVNLVDFDLLKHMKESGCYSIAYGIESGSQRMLDSIHKGIKREQIVDAMKMTRSVGIETVGYFMIGSPGESRETVQETIDFAKQLKLDFAQFAIAIPLPGSELYQIYKDNGGADVPWESFVYEGNQEPPVFESDELKRADLQLLKSKAYKQFYLRLPYVLQRILGIRSIGDVIVNFKGVLMLLRDMISE